MTANNDIRQRATEARVRLWEVAEAYGCVDTTFSRKLRRELPQAEKDKIFSIIDQLKSEREAVNRENAHYFQSSGVHTRDRPRHRLYRVCTTAAYHKRYTPVCSLWHEVSCGTRSA